MSEEPEREYDVIEEGDPFLDQHRFIRTTVMFGKPYAWFQRLSDGKSVMYGIEP